jgi:hypothetical protein
MTTMVVESTFAYLDTFFVSLVFMRSLIGVTPSPDFRIVSIRNLTLFSCNFLYFASSNSISIAESHKRPLEFPDLLDY